MTTKQNNYCVILAGGKGRRLWPCSRDKHPKQFIDFFGVGRTQLQQTFDRFAQVLPKENIYINTSCDYLDLIREQLPEVSSDRIMAEPIHRNTAPSVAWAVHRIMMFDPKANIIVSPSDQTIVNDNAFFRNITDGLQFVENNDAILTMGVSRPDQSQVMGISKRVSTLAMVIYIRCRLLQRSPTDNLHRCSWIVRNGAGTQVCSFLTPTTYASAFMVFFHPSFVMRRAERRLPTIEEEEAFIRENFPRYPKHIFRSWYS